MEDKLKLSEGARIDVLASLKEREKKLLDSIKEHNESKGFQKKEIYIVQGFELKGLTQSHAAKRIRKLIMNAGFHPDASKTNFEEWYKELNIVEEE